MKGIVTSIGLCSYVRFLLAGGLLTFVLTSCTHAQPIDLSTDEAVHKELAKNSEFKSKLDRLCIERIKESAKIIVIGNHANDRGCRIDGAFVNSVYFEDSAALSKNALNTLGWKKAKRVEREKLAMAWVEKGLLAFSTVLYTKDKDLKTDEFQPPRAITKENGEVVVTLWIRFVRRKKEFRLVEIRFAKDGNRL